MTPEELIGPAAAKALAEHYTLTPIAKPLPEVVTLAEVAEFHREMPGSTTQVRLSAFVLRWLRARLGGLPDSWLEENPDRAQFGTKPHEWLERSVAFKALTSREWTP